jgi:hypothetical protein
MPITHFASDFVPGGFAEPAPFGTRTAVASGNFPMQGLSPRGLHCSEVRASTESHTLELSPAGQPDIKIRLALSIDSQQSGAATQSVAGNLETRLTMQDGTVRYGPYRDRFAEVVLADVDDFLERHKAWGEISLLKAGDLDHRLLARLRDGDNFRVDTLDRLAETMTRASAGQLNADDFRNIVRTEEGEPREKRRRVRRRVPA